MIEPKLGRLLLVDDEVESLTPLIDLVSGWGYDSKGCTSGTDALKALKEEDFDLLLADLVMPEISGIELMQEAIKVRPHLVCIIITGKGTVRSAVEAMKLGAFDYIAKPLDFKILRPVLARAMNVSRLRKSEERYRSIVEDQTELIRRWRPDGAITFANEVYCRYFGRTCGEIVGNSFLPLIPEEDHEKVAKHIASLNMKNPVSTVEHRVIAPNGGLRWQSWTDRAIFDDDGNIVEFQAVGRDITEQKKAEEQLRISRDRLRALTKRLSEAEEKERQKIARELHDQVGQNLTALGINLNMLHNQLSAETNKEIDSRLNDSLNLLEETAKRIRDLMADLRPSVLDDYGLMATIRWYSDQFSHRTGLNISIKGDELMPRLSSEIEITLFRIAQEVLTNVAKHARARNVSITIGEVSGIARLIIVDDGMGFDAAGLSQTMEGGRWGLLNIRERAELIGGKMILESEPGKGTRVIIEVRR